jgi:hypothetical protein
LRFRFLPKVRPLQARDKLLQRIRRGIGRALKLPALGVNQSLQHLLLLRPLLHLLVCDSLTEIEALPRKLRLDTLLLLRRS